MKTEDVKRLGLILAKQAEIEGMKWENVDREREGYSLAYSDKDFSHEADNLRLIVEMKDGEL